MPVKQERKVMSNPHPHAASMLLYAQDAAETDKPWERWEFKGSDAGFNGCLKHPEWHEDFEYRRKPKTITVNGIEVPEPAREAPKIGETFFLVELASPALFNDYSWANHIYDNEWLNKGLLHLTEEAAIAHAKALLAPSQRN